MGISVKDKSSIVAKLNECVVNAYSASAVPIALPEEVKRLLDDIFGNIEKASSGYSNLLTCLVCTAINDAVDPRYHREPKKGMSSPPNGGMWFSGRSISEKILVEWMKDDSRNFRVANSGWQTRTYERPYPYDLHYPENISYIKASFLGILDYANRNRHQAQLMISYLFSLEIAFIEIKGVSLRAIAKDNYGNEFLIKDIIDGLTTHFQSERSSHLPVIAIYSIYELLTSELSIYDGVTLKSMDHHNSADIRTGSIGDVEISSAAEDYILEAVEVKHQIKIDTRIVIDAKEKILTSKVKRYYILTTHKDYEVSDSDINEMIEKVFIDHGRSGAKSDQLIC